MKTYKNPIILCDYSDPDVIRVDDTFYMTASSFNFLPGLPILTSKNLVNWTLKNYAISNIPYKSYDTPQNAKGIWAPSIRYHEGTFYIFVGMPDEGLFVTHTKNPLGEWTELSPVWEGKGFEDPCPIWDDDGKLYLVHGYVKSRIGFNSKLGLLELDPVSLKAISEDRFIFDGTKTQPTIEGPKFYKRNGYYYIFAPAGGVTEGWQTVLRSKKIDGDYEEKIVLVQGTSNINGPHQGGWVQTQNGEDWFIHFQEKGIYGRIVHLQPMAWHDDWPLMGTGIETKNWPGFAVEEYRLPNVSSSSKNLDFTDGSETSEWQFSANFKPDWANIFADKIVLTNTCKNQDRKNCSEIVFEYKITDTSDSFTKLEEQTFNDESLLVDNGDRSLVFTSLWETPTVLSQKIKYKAFDFSVTVEFSKLSDNSRTGIVFLGNEYAAVSVEKKSGKLYLSYFESCGKPDSDEKRTEIEKYRKIISSDCNSISVTLSFVPDSERTGFVQFKTADFTSPLFKVEKAHWVGGRFGIFVQ